MIQTKSLFVFLVFIPIFRMDIMICNRPTIHPRSRNNWKHFTIVMVILLIPFFSLQSLTYCVDKIQENITQQSFSLLESFTKLQCNYILWHIRHIDCMFACLAPIQYMILCHTILKYACHTLQHMHYIQYHHDMQYMQCIQTHSTYKHAAASTQQHRRSTEQQHNTKQATQQQHHNITAQKQSSTTA